MVFQPFIQLGLQHLCIDNFVGIKSEFTGNLIGVDVVKQTVYGFKQQRRVMQADKLDQSIACRMACCLLGGKRSLCLLPACLCGSKRVVAVANRIEEVVSALIFQLCKYIGGLLRSG